MYPGNYAIVVVVLCEWIGFNELYSEFVHGACGHCLYVMCAIWLSPYRNDDKLGEIKVWGCADKLRSITKWWRISSHDAGDCGMGYNFKLFVTCN